jgi:hypothetical protein
LETFTTNTGLADNFFPDQCAQQCDAAAQHSTRQYDSDVKEYFSFHFTARIIRSLESLMLTREEKIIPTSSLLHARGSPCSRSTRLALPSASVFRPFQFPAVRVTPLSIGQVLRMTGIELNQMITRISSTVACPKEGDSSWWTRVHAAGHRSQQHESLHAFQLA